jgi:hypothetical protein
MTKWLLVSVGLGLGFLFPHQTVQNGNSAVTEKDQQAIVQAIKDEIYDWGCQSHVEFVGKKIAAEKTNSAFTLILSLKRAEGKSFTNSCRSVKSIDHSPWARVGWHICGMTHG